MNKAPQTTDLHTPGPWRAAKTPMNPWWNIYIGDSQRCIADIEGAQAVAWNDPDKPEAVAANARLIAAAPELLDALRKLVAWQAESKHATPLIHLESAKAAIARAEGCETCGDRKFRTVRLLDGSDADDQPCPDCNPNGDSRDAP